MLKNRRTRNGARLLQAGRKKNKRFSVEVFFVLLYNAGMEIRDSVKEKLDLLRLYRRDLHQIPEPSLKEYKTQEYICNALAAFKIEYRRIATGVVAFIKGKNPDFIAFLSYHSATLCHMISVPVRLCK